MLLTMRCTRSIDPVLRAMRCARTLWSYTTGGMTGEADGCTTITIASSSIADPLFLFFFPIQTMLPLPLLLAVVAGAATSPVDRFLRGDLHVASWHCLATLRRSGDLEERIAAAKTLVWIRTSQNHLLLPETERMLYRLLARRNNNTRTAAATGSVFDLPMQRRICSTRSPTAASSWRERYFDLLRRSLTNYLYCNSSSSNPTCAAEWDLSPGLHAKTEGEDPVAHSVAPSGNLLHLQLVVEAIEAEHGPRRGDVLHAGCFRGGGGVLLAAALAGTGRRLFVADSFQGIPMATSEVGKRVDETQEWTHRYRAGIDGVRDVFRRYGFADDGVTFVPGFFNTSLVGDGDVSRARFALIHIDVDAYDSVLQVLEATYDRLEVGGYVVVDDLHLYGVREALLRFRRARGITAPLLPVPLDYTSACSTTSSKSSDYHLTCINPVSTGYWVAV